MHRVRIRVLTAVAVAGAVWACAAAGASAADPDQVTTTTVSCVPSPATVGSASSCTARVDPIFSSGFPTGTVSFTAAGPGGSFAASTCTLAALTGASLCKAAYVPSQPGSHQITATYQDGGSHLSSFGEVVLQAEPKPAATTKKKCKKTKKKRKCKKKRKKGKR